MRNDAHAIRGLLGLLTLYGPLPPLLQRLDDGDAPLPMKVGILADLRERFPDAPGNKVWALRRAIALSAAYCEACLADGAMRHDLDGNPVEPVEEEARELAKQRLEHLKARVKAEPRVPPPPPLQPEPVAEASPSSQRVGPSGRPILGLNRSA